MISKEEAKKWIDMHTIKVDAVSIGHERVRVEHIPVESVNTLMVLIYGKDYIEVMEK